MKCGRQPGGHHIHNLGVCPVTQEERLDGIHEGTNAGRSCWVIAGSLCGGTIQGSFAEKFRNCEKCDFYRLVKNEEFPRVKLSAMLLAKLKEPVGAL